MARCTTTVCYLWNDCQGSNIKRIMSFSYQRVDRVVGVAMLRMPMSGDVYSAHSSRDSCLACYKPSLPLKRPGISQCPAISTRTFLTSWGHAFFLSGVGPPLPGSHQATHAVRGHSLWPLYPPDNALEEGWSPCLQMKRDHYYITAWSG